MTAKSELKAVASIIEPLRRSVCVSCPSGKYRVETDCCVAISEREHPGRLGSLTHFRGISNPQTSCPMGHFGKVLTDHTIWIKSHFGLSNDFDNELEHRRPHEGNLLAWGQKIRRAMRIDPLLPEGNGKPLLSKILIELKEIVDKPNGYTEFMRSQENTN